MTYKTSQIARLVGVHANTIRLYEELKLLPPVPRTESGYRIFHDRHLKQLYLLRTAFRSGIVSDRLRQEVYEIVKTAATNDIEAAYMKTESYLEHLRVEKDRAEEAIRITLEIIEHSDKSEENVVFTGRVEVAKVLGITIDILRDWERNGLIEVPRSSNVYRKYREKEMKRLKIIRTLRNAHYSMMSILRMLNRLDRGETNIREAIDTPEKEEDIVYVTDRYMTALKLAEADALEMLRILEDIKRMEEQT